MRTEMSSRERLLAAFRRQPHDHVPFSPYTGQGPWWERPLYWRDQFERADRMLELGLDPTIDIWLPDPEPHPDVEIRTWRDTSGPEPLLTKEYRTPAGVLRQVVRESPDWCSAQHGPWVPTTFGIEKRAHYNLDLIDDHAVSRRTEPWIKGEADLEKLRYLIRAPRGHALDEWRMDAARAGEMARQREVLLQARRTITGDAFMWFCDIPEFAVCMIEAPGFVREFLAIFEGWAEDLTVLALEAKVDVVQHRGWYEIPTYWGVQPWREYLMPFVQRQAAMVHAAGKLHSYLLPEGHGPLSGALRELGTDVLFAVDPRKLHGGDLHSLFAALGDGKCFWGGVNAEVTVASGSEAQIRAEVREAVEALGGNHGLVLSALLFSDVPTARILALVEAWRECADR
ncbi:MAG: uroporphyrinogen decarboxylase family protein [Candidatus Latescibacterota bacterium]